MSILGSLGPLVQGSTRGRTFRIGTAALYASAFVAGATAAFAAVHALGSALGAHDLPLSLRAGVSAAGLVSLAAVDVVALRSSRYCPIGPRRQTPRTLQRRHSPPVVAAAWGLDTGLAVTTFRVAAVTWGALLLAGLGLTVRWAGLAYGLGHAVPSLYLLFRHRVGRCARDPGPADPGLAEMVSRRTGAQAASAALLVGASGLLILELAG